jgi:phage terminase large subunit GpA-like protein
MQASNAAEQIDLIETAPLRLPLRPWMPSSWRKAVAGRQVELNIPPAVRSRCRRAKRMAPSELSVKYRQMPAADTHTGPYRREFARHATKVMDTWAMPWVREVWFCGVDQGSKTNTKLSCIAWVIDQAPGNIFYQMPNEKASDKIMEKKLVAMIKGSPRLAQHLSPRANDTTLGGVTLTNGMSIIPAWSGSTTSTAVFSARYTFSDEVDKMEMVGKEASPLDRIRKRGRTERFAKNFFGGTPAGKWLHKGTMACVQVWEGTMRCPHCSELMGMTEEQVIIPEGATVESIKADPGCVEYACDQCGELLTEADREHAYNSIMDDADAWKCIKGEEVKKPVDVGFILSAFPLPDVSLAEIATTILKGRAGDGSAKIDLAHGIKAIDYVEEQKDRQEDAILRLCDDRPAGQVHPESDILTLVADTQDKGFWYEVRGWRFGSDLKSWQVKYGFVPSAHTADFSALDYLIDEERYFDNQDREYKIAYAMIDALGHRTAEVYAWCKGRGAFPAMGARTRKVRPVSISRTEVYPNGKPIPGGLNRYSLDTHYHKDLLHNKLKVDATDPGAWVLHSGYDREQLNLMQRDPGVKLQNGNLPYAKQFCVEYRDDRGLWQCPEGKANHMWDVGQMSIAMAYFLKFNEMVREEDQPKEEHQQKHHLASGGKPAWFNNRGGRG